MRRWAALMLITLGFLAAGETIVRLTHASTQLFRRGENLEMFRDSPLTFWELRPGYSGSHENVLIPQAHRSIPVRINRHGFRGPEVDIEKPAKFVRLMVMGDSTTFGYSIDESQTYAAQLSDLLKRAPTAAIEVVNGGVPGFSSLQSAIDWRNRLQTFRPDILVMALDGINDIQNREQTDRMLQTSMSRALGIKKVLYHSRFYLWLRKEITELSRRHRASKAAGQMYLRVTPEQYQEHLRAIAEQALQQHCRVIFLFIPTRRLLEENEAQAIKSPEVFDRRAFDLAQKGLSLLNCGEFKDAVAVLEASLARQPDSSLTHGLLSVGYEHLGDHAKALEHQKASERLPGINLWSYRRAMRETAAQMGLPFVDLTAVFIENARGEPAALFLEAIHPNERGHQLIALELEKAVRTELKQR